MMIKSTCKLLDKIQKIVSEAVFAPPQCQNTSSSPVAVSKTEMRF